MAEIPSSIRAALELPPLERRSWQNAIAPQYIALFLWVVYFDQLPRRTLPVGGLLWSVAGAAAAGLLCYLLLYFVPAMWGLRVGRSLPVAAARTFGLQGSAWLTVVGMGLAHVIWAAVATSYGTQLCLEGLIPLGLLEPRALQPWGIGVISLPSPLFLFTSLGWVFAAGLVGHYLFRVIAALMRVFPIFLAALLGTAMVMTARGLPEYRPSGVDPLTLLPAVNGGPRAFVMTIQWIFGFFATAGLAAADWGTVARDRRDVQLGGLTGVAFAAWTVATLALLTVAGALGLHAPAQPAGAASTALPPSAYDFHNAVLTTLPGLLAGAVLIGFGLASLAPTCYATFVYSHRFASTWPRVKRIRWTLLGTTAAWLLIVAGVPGRLETILTLMGAVFAPAVGAMAADYARSRGAWDGPRAGVNRAALVAWAVGMAVGFVPLISGVAGVAPGARFQPASVFAFLTSFLVYTVVARLGMESAVVPLPQPAEAGEANVAASQP